MEREGDGDTYCNTCIRNNPKGLVNRLEDLEIGGQVNTFLYYKDQPEY